MCHILSSIPGVQFSFPLSSCLLVDLCVVSSIMSIVQVLRILFMYCEYCPSIGSTVQVL